MAREKPTIGSCRHHYPIEVVRMQGGKRARCLGCMACGPLREGAQEAMQVLRDEARYPVKVGT